MDAITAAVHELAEQAVRVLSPADPRIVAQQGEFLFVASDPVTSVRLVQDRHLESIRAADFLWLVCPDGYVGQLASMEVGYAAGVGIPVFARRSPSDLTLREYVTVVTTPKAAVQRVTVSCQSRRAAGLLIDPHASIEEAHKMLERVERSLVSKRSIGDAARGVHDQLAALGMKLGLPTYTH
jgi:hypothetical protein